MSEPDLMHRFFDEIHGQDYGMRRTFGRVAAYLKAEQELRRLGDFDVQAAVTTLVGSMMALGMSGMVTGHSEAESREQIPGDRRDVAAGDRRVGPARSPQLLRVLAVPAHSAHNGKCEGR
jgi:hypothetical protein